VVVEDGRDLGRLSHMLQRLLDSLDEVEGNWSRDQLLAMDAAYTAAVEAAFRVGFESPAAASATVRIGARNGREAVIESALEAAWNWLVSNMDEGKDVAFVEVLAFARERCLGVTAEQVRVEFKKRLKERWQSAPRAA
jgi:hypothetical protein